MTTKLYENSQDLLVFRARVRECLPRDGGFGILLDRTAFFPEEGGQGADHGRLGDANVTDVRLSGDEILHITDAPLPVGAEVEGCLDAARRRRHMQVHTGEHILSGVLHTLFGATNVGFHLGDGEVTLDLDIPLAEKELAAAEEAANRAVFENRAVRILYPTPEELPHLDYRAKLALSEGVRLVEIEGVDLCACCAPHVARTGECGLIKIVSHMNYKGGTRLSIAVGVDALADYRQKQENVHAVSVALSVPEAEVADGVARLQSALSAERGVSATLRAALRAERLSALPRGDAVLSYPDLDAGALRLYAEEGAARTEGTVLVLLPTGETCRYAMASRSADVKARAAALHALLGGRGGGHPSLVQGSFAASADAVRAAFREA